MARKKHKERGHRKKHTDPKSKKSEAKPEAKLRKKGSNKLAGDPNEGNVAKEGSVYGVVGLANLRNTCYFNSVLQVLVSSQQMQRYYGDFGHEAEGQSGALAMGMRDVFSACKGISQKPGKSHVYRPNRMLDAIRKVCPTFKAKHQHDAHELMSALIQELVDEEVQKSKKTKQPKDTFVAGKFCGEFGSSLSCQNCSYVKNRKEDFFGISVPIVKDKSLLKDSADCHTSTEQQQPSSMPPPTAHLDGAAVGSVVERTDLECSANLLGGHCEQEPVLCEHVSVIVSEHGVSLKVDKQLPCNSPGNETVLAFPSPKDYKESSSGCEDALDRSSCCTEGGSSDAYSEVKQIESCDNDMKDRISSRQSPNECVDDYLLEEAGRQSSSSSGTQEFESFESEFTEVTRKGKKGRKMNQRTQVDEAVPSKRDETSNLKTLEECIDEYFSPEMVYWKCPVEFPERRIKISEEAPEVFVIPRKDPCRIMTDCPANRFSTLRSRKEPSDSSDEEESETGTSGSPTGDDSPASQDSAAPIPLLSAKELKSCLKKPTEPSSPRIRSVNSVKHCRIWTMPDVLLIHLKRFEVNSRGRLTKLNQHIQFDKELDLSGFCEEDSPDAHTARYVLKGVICHSGSLFAGHYVAYVLRSIESPQWYYVSDQDVQQVKESSVMASQAYILMYERICSVSDERNEAYGAEVFPGVPFDEDRSDSSCEKDHLATEDSSQDSIDEVVSCPEATDSDAQPPAI